MFGHRRRGFGGDESPVPGDGFANAGGYEEKTVFTVDGGAPEQNGASAAPSSTAVKTDFSSAYTGGERPRVFVSKENSGVYIYEFSDRLEYYVKLDTGMFMFNVVKKPIGR